MLESLIFAILAIAFLIFTIGLFAVFFMAVAKQYKRSDDFVLQLMTALDTPGLSLKNIREIIGKHREHQVVIKYICPDAYSGIKDNSTIIVYLQIYDYKISGSDNVISEMPDKAPDLAKLKDELRDLKYIEGEIQFKNHAVYITMTLPVRPIAQTVSVVDDENKGDENDKVDLSEAISDLRFVLNKTIDNMESQIES